MEYPSKYDFFIRFKALFNEKGRFIDYILIEVSDNFSKATKITSDFILGMKLADMAIDIDSPVLGLKDFHYHMLPNTRRKFEHFVQKDNRWYLVNLYSDERDYLMMIYTDITKVKEEAGRRYLAEASDEELFGRQRRLG
ncbi:hypothetical protein [Gudongella oleilytica]|uniref:hypothetical protein n=1 Tax=Gudongella oleilytica TaxID=1582259 RepID=UPI002A3691AC|nr:hypothetical protein [Gudongella oleilytica]MDY0255886.1 hypothetical protein [Gudongella oleilytica]